MRLDGVQLTDIELDIFLSGIQDGVEQALFLLGVVGAQYRSMCAPHGSFEG